MPFWTKAKKPQEQPPQTILVIDDDPTTQKIVQQALTKSGYLVLTASSGEAGLEAARDKNPDAIILDVLMPGMDGFMLIKELRSREATKGKPVIVLTSRDNVGDTFQRFGADAFLTKPVNPPLLLETLRKLTGQ
ncbi:MAG: response regulator [Candidatus Omnitrophota bacterium]|nr:response regulator [Candidatus Omnitrophota bacterium]MDZ4242259.1 response regulator [Candidatus Omnitrophota bacterium]